LTSCSAHRSATAPLKRLLRRSTLMALLVETAGCWCAVTSAISGILNIGPMYQVKKVTATIVMPGQARPGHAVEGTDARHTQTPQHFCQGLAAGGGQRHTGRLQIGPYRFKAYRHIRHVVHRMHADRTVQA